MNVMWRKVWRDLAHNKARTALVVLSTAIGVFALGLVFGLSGLLRTRMTEDHRMRIPSHITFLGEGYDEQVVEAIWKEPGILYAESETRASLRWKLEGETDWRSGEIIARPSFGDQRIDLIELADGLWPAGRAVAPERQSSRYFGLPLGTAIIAEFGRGERRLPVEGIVRGPDVIPPQLGGTATFYATGEAVAWLTGVQSPNRLSLILPSFGKEVAERMAEQVQDRIERMGLTVEGYYINDPRIHPLQETVDTLAVILGVLGALALGLSAFLIINTTSALITQQVWQIGVMKVVGATAGRITGTYLATALIYGLLALGIAAPMGIIGAHAISNWLLDLINVHRGSFQVMPNAIVLQLVVSLSVPVMAAWIPVIGGARITPHQAIISYGLGGRFGQSLLDRLIGGIRFLPRPLALSLRNTFRRKTRLAWTLLALALGGTLFTIVMSIGSSLNNTLEMLMSDYGLDVWAVFDRPHRAVYLTEVARGVPGVTGAEVWTQRPAMLNLEHGEQYEILVMALPPDSRMFRPRIVRGRPLLPEDGRAVLINSKIAADQKIAVNDEVTITVGGKESTWTVVGLVLNVGNGQRDCFVPLDAWGRVDGTVDRGTVVMVSSGQRDAQSQQALIQSLRDAYVARHIRPSFFLSSNEVRAQNRAQFNIILYLMLTMAFLGAVVGGFGLMGTMSINVVERTREIGVMRAIGATSSTIVGVFASEGIFLGVLSWAIAALFSYPSARIFSDLVGRTLLQVPLDFSYSVEGLVLWLGIVVVLSGLASLWPSLSASKMSVRKALAYE